MATQSEVILKIRGVTKTFGATIALSDASLDIMRGEVHAVVGSNGAGKSTLMKLLSGLYAPDSGSIEYMGSDIAGLEPLAVQRLGIQTVHQVLNIVGSMTVLENILISNPPMKANILLWKKGLPDVMETLSTIDFPLDLKMPAERLSVSQQQFIIIARAIISGARVLILDEPTARLGLEETNKLFSLIRKLKRQGTTVLYISHRMEEIYAISDSISVFRDGRLVLSKKTSDLSSDELVSAMIGRKLEVFFPKAETEIGTELLRIEDLYDAGHVHGVSLNVNRGEIVALIGAVGAGKTEIVNCIFGILQPQSGRIVIKGAQMSLNHSPADMIRAGLALIPEDRFLQGMVSDYTVSENISSVDMSKASVHGVLLRAREDSLARGIVSALDIRPNDVHKPMTALSGGNQQKVVLGKWLTDEYCVYLMDEVTAGVDIQAKAAIYGIMGEIVKKGGAVLLSTGDIEEALGVADRIIVLFKGKIIFETARDTTSKDELLTYIMGGGANA